MKGQLGVCRILLEFCADDKAVDNVSRRALNSTIEEKYKCCRCHYFQYSSVIFLSLLSLSFLIMYIKTVISM